MRARCAHLRRLGLCPDRVGSETQPTPHPAFSRVGRGLECGSCFAPIPKQRSKQPQPPSRLHVAGPRKDFQTYRVRGLLTVSLPSVRVVSSISQGESKKISGMFSAQWGRSYRQFKLFFGYLDQKSRRFSGVLRISGACPVPFPDVELSIRMTARRGDTTELGEHGGVASPVQAKRKVDRQAVVQVPGGQPDHVARPADGGSARPARRSRIPAASRSVCRRGCSCGRQSRWWSARCTTGRFRPAA
jgi:hypothetical protein